METGDHYNNYLGLNLSDPVHKAFNYAFFFGSHLTEKGKKITVRKYEKEMDKVSEQALQLSQTIKSLKSTYRNSLMFSMSSQHDIPINSCDQIDHFIQSLAKAAQATKEAKLKPISNGYYNGFLFQGINNLLIFLDLDSYFSAYLYFEKIEPSNDTAMKFLLDFWETGSYSERVRETAIYIIYSKLNASSNDKRTAEKTVDKHLSAIINERIQNKVNLLIKTHNLIKDMI